MCFHVYKVANALIKASQMDEMERSLMQVEEQLGQAIDRKIDGLEREVDDLNNIIRNTKKAWTLIEVKLKKEKFTALAALARSKMLLAEMELLITESELNDISGNPSKKNKLSPEQPSTSSEDSCSKVQSLQQKSNLSRSCKSATPSGNNRKKRASSSTSQINCKSHLPNGHENNGDESLTRCGEKKNLCINKQKNALDIPLETVTAIPFKSSQNSGSNLVWRKAFSDPTPTSNSKKKIASLTNVRRSTVSEKPADIISATPVTSSYNSSCKTKWKKAFSDSVTTWVEKINLFSNEHGNPILEIPVNAVPVHPKKSWKNICSNSDPKGSSTNSNSPSTEKSDSNDQDKIPCSVDIFASPLTPLQNSSTDSDWNKSLSGSIIAKLDEIEKVGCAFTLTKEQPKDTNNIKMSGKNNSHTPSASKKPALYPGDPRKSYSDTYTQSRRTPMLLALPKIMSNRPDV